MAQAKDVARVCVRGGGLFLRKPILKISMDTRRERERVREGEESVNELGPPRRSSNLDAYQTSLNQKIDSWLSRGSVYVLKTARAFVVKTQGRLYFQLLHTYLTQYYILSK